MDSAKFAGEVIVDVFDRHRSEGRLSLLSAIKPKKQVTHRAPSEQCSPALPAVFGTIMRKVAPLAQSCEVLRIIVAWIMIEVGACEHDACRLGRRYGRGQIFEPKLSRLQAVLRA